MRLGNEMKREAVLEQVELNPLGEIRMGCNAYGLQIKTNFGDFELFKDVPILIGHTDYSKCIEQSECQRYLLLRGGFGIYILDIKDQSISIYKLTIRGENNELSEENPIFGKEKQHISGFSKSYFLQFPFVKKTEFNNVLSKFETLRKKQINELVNALS